MKRWWDYKDTTLVSKQGTLTEDDLLAYWASIDEALQFWETGKKKVYNERMSSFVSTVHKDHQFQSSSREQHIQRR